MEHIAVVIFELASVIRAMQTAVDLAAMAVVETGDASPVLKAAEIKLKLAKDRLQKDLDHLDSMSVTCGQLNQTLRRDVGELPH